MRVRSLRGVAFDWVTGDLELAITERNFRITGRNTIGKGLRERGYADYPDFEVIHFCNLENARAVLDLDPRFVAQMPCRVTVHVEGDAVVVSMLLLPESHPDPRAVAFSRSLNAELCAIQDYAVAARQDAASQHTCTPAGGAGMPGNACYSPASTEP